MENLEPGPEPAVAVAVAAEPIDERRCGRCQLMFPAEPDRHETALAGFWMCAPCRTALIPHQSRGRF